MSITAEFLSVSDDDLCSECRHLGYCPGRWSHCGYGFPGDFDEDGYCIACEEFDQIAHRGDNWLEWEE